MRTQRATCFGLGVLLLGVVIWSCSSALGGAIGATYRSGERPGAGREDIVLEAGAPPEILSNLSSCQISATLRPTSGADPGPGVRAVLLHTKGGPPVEAHERWPDGFPRSASAELPTAFMKRALIVLVEAGFFERANHLVQAGSPVLSSEAPAEVIETWPVPGPPEPHLALSVSVDGDRRTHRWVEHSPLFGAALETLRALTTELVECSDLEGFAYLSALYNQAEEAFRVLGESEDPYSLIDP